jgi:histone H3/H4
MIQQGEMTIIDAITYRCLKVEDGYAHLKNIIHEQGRPKLVKAEYCPYIRDGELVVPEQPKPERYSKKTKINITSLIKENTDLVVSNDAKYFITEWVETAISNLIANAEESAINRNDKRITAAHFFWLETNEIPVGYWPENMKYMQE